MVVRPSRTTPKSLRHKEKNDLMTLKRIKKNRLGNLENGNRKG